MRDLSMVSQSILLPLHRAPSTTNAVKKVCPNLVRGRNQLTSLARSVEKISHTLQQYRSILQKLFPMIHPEQLQGLTREKLVDLISKTSSFQPPSPLSPNSDDKPISVHHDAGSLEQLQPLPEDSLDDFETQDHHKVLDPATGDVNALSFPVKHSSSYLGIASATAALRVILWLDPQCQAFINKYSNPIHLTSKFTSMSSNLSRKATGTASATNMQHPSTLSELSLLDGYFKHVHPFIPLIDEHSFRDTYTTSKRHDSRWSLLLNAVLATGSIASGTSDDTVHCVYYGRAKQYLNIDNLGLVHVETVQALAILGGFYLHYTQQPTLANALMGACLRMAVSLGLHRDYTESLRPTNTVKAASYSMDMRRRVWWSVFMLDTWASSTLGRPSMGRWSHAITAHCPEETIVSNHLSLQALTDTEKGGSTAILSLHQENIRFCIISTRIEDSLACSPLLEETERQTLDCALVDWFDSSSVKSSDSHGQISETGSGVTVLENVMRWRYMSLRVILHRPVLLWYAMRKMSFDNLSEDKKTAIDLCRDVTADLIADIASTWKAQKACQMSGWNAACLMYQAVMVPLLSLFTDSTNPDAVQRSQQQVETVLATLTELEQWSSTARRSIAVVTHIYEAARRYTSDHQESTDYYSDTSTPAVTTNIRLSYHDLQYANKNGTSKYSNTPSKALQTDNMFDSLNWSTGWTNNDYPFATPGHGWHDEAGNCWGGNGDSDGYFHTVFLPEEQAQMSVRAGTDYGAIHQGQHEISVGHFNY